MIRMTNGKPPRGGWAKTPELARPSAPFPALGPAPVLDRTQDPPNAPFIAGSGLWQPLGTARNGGRDAVEFGTVDAPNFAGFEFTLVKGPVRDLEPGGHFLDFAETEAIALTFEVGRDGSQVQRPVYGGKYRRLEAQRAGTFARLTAKSEAPVGKVGPYRPADLLREYARFLGLRNPHDPQTWLRFAAGNSVLLSLDTTGTELVRWYPLDRHFVPGNKVDAAIDAAAPILVGALGGSPARCAIDGCKRNPHPAVTTTYGNLPWCGEDPERAPEGARPEPSSLQRITKAARSAVGLT